MYFPQDSSSKSESTSSHDSSNNKNNRSSGKNGITNSVGNNKKLNKVRSQPAFVSSSNSSSASPSPNTTIQEHALNSTQATEKNNSSKISAEIHNKNISDEGAFEIAVRGKGIKRGKGCSVPVLPDISADHCLELPYSPKTVKPPSIPTDSVLKRSKRKAVRVQSDSCVLPSMNNTTKTATVKPNKIEHKPIISLVNSNSTNSCTTSSDFRSAVEPPSQPSRDSYSSKVLGHEKQKAKVTPIGKILPEVKRVAPQVQQLGVIGQKMAPQIPVFNQSLFSHDLPQHPALQQFYANSPPSMSIHSWDPKTVAPSGMSPSVPPSGLSTLGDQQWGEYKQLPLASPPVWANTQPPVPTPLPSSPASWDNISAIWSSNSMSGGGGGGASLWAPNIAVSQGLGFDPFRSVSWPNFDSDTINGGWPNDMQQRSSNSTSPHKTEHV